MSHDLNVSLAIRIVRDVYNRCGFSTLCGIYVEEKADGSLVTDIDPLVEHIVLEHLSATAIADKYNCVREEAASGEAKTIGEIKQSEYLVTIDGIDGTGDFVRHFNRGEHNSKWLVALTAVYQKTEDELYDPIFAFGLQPEEDRLFVMHYDEHQKKALLVKHPLGRTQSFELSVENISDGPEAGSLDVFLDKPVCNWKLSDPASQRQTGPSGFNTASLAAAAAPFDASAGSDNLTFTTFHYKLWDFGLWPVLHAAGVKTVVKELDGLSLVEKLNLNWFGDDNVVSNKCDSTPIILSKGGKGFDPRAIA